MTSIYFNPKLILSVAIEEHFPSSSKQINDDDDFLLEPFSMCIIS